LALLFLFVLILPLAEPLSAGVAHGLDIANVVIWLLFAADYLILLYLALDRRTYLRTHILELLVVVLPILRPFRLLRLFAIVASTTRRAGGLVVRRVTVFVCCIAAISLATAAVVVFDAEKSEPDRTIHTLGDAMWWATSTVTTVGYGDVYPKSVVGRLTAAALMLVGIALVGTITAAVASVFVNIVRNSSTAREQNALATQAQRESAQLTELTAAVERLTREVAELRAERS
jgi:voltage-gated potassium channel